MKKRIIAFLVGIAMCFSQGQTIMAEGVSEAYVQASGRIQEYSDTTNMLTWNFEESYILAVGCDAKIMLENEIDQTRVLDYSVKWETDNPGIASVQDGIVQALAEGETKVRAVCTYSYYEYDYSYGEDDYNDYYDDYYYDDYYYDDYSDYGYTFDYGDTNDYGNSTDTQQGKILKTKDITYERNLRVTNPRWKNKSAGINIYNEWGYSGSEETSAELLGVSEDSRVSCKTSSKKLSAYWDGSYVYFSASKSGTYTVTLTVDGKTLDPFTVYVYKLYFKRNSKTICDEGSKKWLEGQSVVGLYKGETTTLVPKGFKKGTKIQWKSSKPGVVSVNKKGKIKGKANGTAVITASSDRGKISYKVSVSYKSAIKAIRYANAHFNSEYSQPKRMSKGYYDCSSFVWRAYKDAGYTLGNDKYYAPTAADLAKWCVEKGYKVAEGSVNLKKLLPGDLVFWTGENNGRYKGIYHVDLYTGEGIAMTVKSYKYIGYDGNVLICRPCKGHK